MILLKVAIAKNVWFVTIDFFNHEFEFQDSLCNGCHDLTMLFLIISDIAIITIKGVDCCCIIDDISKFEAIYLLKNSMLEDRGYI